MHRNMKCKNLGFDILNFVLSLLEKILKLEACKNILFYSKNLLITKLRVEF